ncbi:MAG: hypothetical protein HN396_17550 [Gemmatimonadales bacterium]|jgi:hypothetical protein|nr:hypothetical protein [Gemmatimonadales bacterium]
MRSQVYDTIPSKLRRDIEKIGHDIAIARRKRRLTITMMTERVGIHKNTYFRVEKGDPTVSFGIYAMTLFVLGLADRLGDLVDARRDDQGLLLDEQRLAKRIRPKKDPEPL